MALLPWESSVVAGIPCVLFVCGIHKIYKQGRTMQNASYLDFVWLTVYIIVQMMATVWLATALSSFDNQWQAPLATVTAAMATGPYVGGTLLLVLYTRTISAACHRICGKASLAVRRGVRTSASRIWRKIESKGRK